MSDRVPYQVNDTTGEVIVLRIDHRRDAYRRNEARCTGRGDEARRLRVGGQLEPGGLHIR